MKKNIIALFFFILFFSLDLSAQNYKTPYQDTDEFGIFALGDMGTGWSNEYKLFSLIAKYPIKDYSAILLLGDISYPDGNPKLIESNITKPYKPVFEAGFKFYPAIGNHEFLFEKAKYIKEYFNVPYYYNFKIGSAEFWSLDVNSGGARFDKEQAEWLKDSLVKSSAIWKIVFFHESPYSSGIVHGNNNYLIKNLVPILETNKVDLCLTAHNHLYERTEEINGVLYITSGGGSASLHKYDKAIGFNSAFVKSIYHFLKIKGNAKELKIEAINLENEVFDSIILNKD